MSSSNASFASFPTAENPEQVLAAQLLTHWGFTAEAPAALKTHAAQSAQYGGMAFCSYPDLVSALGLVPREQAEQALADKPANILPLEHLVQKIPTLREQALRLSAIVRQIPFFSSLAPEWAQTAPDLDNAARVRADELNAAVLASPMGKPMVVFSDVAGLLSFSQAGRQERQKDALHQALKGEVVYGLAMPSVVAKSARVENTNQIQVLSNAAHDNFWMPGMAKTEAERVLARLLDEALSRRATDVEISPQRDGTAKVRIRIFGDMTSPDRHAVLSPEFAKEITNFLLSRSRASDGGRLRKPADGQMTYKNAQAEVFLRTSFIPADRSGLDFEMVSSSLRLLPRTARSISLEELNLGTLVNQEVRKALMRTQGLIVLAGPTNSGKSTTIAGVVGEHVKMFGATKKRLSLEDPVERYLEGITQISVDSNFAELIRALLRHDPDMVWVGEIRDAFSAAACVRAATSGHVVLSTVHANNSILAFRAVANYLRKDTGEATGGGASLFDLAESVSLLIGQRLVKRLCPHCRKRHRPSDEDCMLAKDYLSSEGQGALWPEVERVIQKGVYHAKPGGCKHCQGTGYVGELPVNELLPATREVRNLFAQSESRLDFDGLAQHRLNTLSQSALKLIEAGETEFTSLFI